MLPRHEARTDTGSSAAELGAGRRSVLVARFNGDRMSDDNQRPMIVGKIGYFDAPDGSRISIIVPIDGRPQALNLTTGQMHVMKPDYDNNPRHQ